jgi:tetratricopeptide (TPR) repeat protein
MSKRKNKALLTILLGFFLVISAAGAAVVARRLYVAETARRAFAEGTVLFERNDYERALPLLARYVGRNRSDVKALLMLAECRALVPKPEGTEVVEAARYAEAALARDPKNERAMTLLIGWYGRLGFLTELDRTADAILAVNPESQLGISTKAQAAMALGKYDQALELASRLAAAQPDSADPHRLMLEALRLRGASPTEIAQEAGKAAKERPANFEIAVIHAQTLLGAKDAAGAATAVTTAADLPPSSLRGLGDLLRSADAVAAISRIAGPGSGLPTADEIQTSVRATLVAASKSQDLGVGALSLAVGWEWRGGRLDRAQEWLTASEGSATEPVGVLGWRAVLARDQAKPWEGYASSIRAVPTSAQSPWRGLVDVFAAIDRGEWTAAMEGASALIKRCEQALTFAGSALSIEEQLRRAEASEVLVIAEYQSGHIAKQMGEWRTAIRHWTSASESEPFWSLPLTAAAQTILDRGQIETAFDFALRAMRIRPGFFEALMLARVSVLRDEMKGSPSELSIDSVALLDGLVPVDPIRAEALCLRARANLSRKNLEAARKDIQTIASLTPPADPGMLFALSAAMRRAGEPGWESLQQSAMQALNPSARAKLQASDELAAGRNEQALDIVRRAAASADPDSSISLRLEEARILAVIGDQAQARQVLSDLSSTNANDPAVQIEVLGQPITWTEVGLVDAAIGRLRAASGPDAVEWKLANATRVLTFSPEPAKAQEIIVQLNDIIRTDPNNAQAHSLLAEWMMVLDAPDAAIDHLTRAIAIRDTPASLYPRLIRLLANAGRADEAKTRLRTFAGLAGLSESDRRTRARLLAEFQLRDEAIAEWRELAADGSAEDTVSYARALSAEGASTEAAQLIEKILHSPNLTDDQFMAVAFALVEAGDPDRAIKLYDARAPSDGPPKAKVRRAALLNRAGRFSEAEQALSQAVQDDPSAENILELSRFHARRGNPEMARRVISEARQRGVSTPELEAADALAASLTQQLTPEQQQAVIQSIPEGPERELAEATRWFDANPTDRPGFIERLRKITNKAPRLELAWRFLVQHLADQGQIEEAIKAARSASAAIPSSLEVARMETTILLMSGRPAEAEPAARRWDALAKGAFDAKIAIAQALILTDREREARAILEPLADQHAGEAPASDQRLWASFVESFARLGETDRARDLAARRSSDEPGWRAAQIQIAANNAMPVAAAREWLTDLRSSIDPASEDPLALAEGFAALAERSDDARDIEAAFDLLRPGLSKPDVKVGQQLMAASLLERLKRESEAEALYRAIITKEPKQWLALNNLAFLLISRGAPSDEPLALCRRTFEVTSGLALNDSVKSQLYQTRALAELGAKLPAEAMESARTALRLDPASGSAAFVEAKALEASGQPARALDAARSLIAKVESGRGTLTPEELRAMQELVKRLDPQDRPPQSAP